MQVGRLARSAEVLPATKPEYWGEMVGSRPPKVWVVLGGGDGQDRRLHRCTAVYIGEGVVGIGCSRTGAGVTAEDR